MNTTIRNFIFTMGLVIVSTASLLASQEKLTPQRVAELTAPIKADSKEKFHVEISDVGKAELSSSNNYETIIIRGDKFIYPTRFDPPQKASNPVVTPSFPKGWKSENLGLRIQLHAKRVGSVIVLYGVVERTKFMGFINNTTGELQGPIVDKITRKTLAINTINQPMFQKDISYIYLTAIPGDSYEVPFFEGKSYKGKQTEKHTIKVTLK